MKNKRLIVLTIAMSLMTTACASNKQIVKKLKTSLDEMSSASSASETEAEISSTAETESEMSSSESSVYENTNQTALTREYAADNVSFCIGENWGKYDRSKKEHAFISTDGKTVYMLQGVSQLGSFTPEEFYKLLIDEYNKDANITKSNPSMEDFITADGIPSKVARIEMTNGESLYLIDVLIVPQKNTVITFAANTVQESNMPVELREITKTVKVNIAAEDCISGNTFIADDGSELCLSGNGEFIYYQSETDHNMPYYTGKYEVCRGQDAINKVDSMSSYGLTKEEQEQTLSANMNGYKPGGSMPADYISPENNSDSGSIYQICKDSYYAVILHNEKLVESGNTSDIGIDTLYIGFYIPELELADMVNANTASNVSWTLKGKTG